MVCVRHNEHLVAYLLQALNEVYVWLDISAGAFAIENTFDRSCDTSITFQSACDTSITFQSACKLCMRLWVQGRQRFPQVLLRGRPEGFLHICRSTAAHGGTTAK